MPRTSSPLVLWSCLLALLLNILWPVRSSPAAPPPPTPTRQAGQVEQAVRAALSAQAELIPILIQYETQLSTPDFSSDGGWAVVMLTPVIPGSGQAAPVEPGLALSRLESGDWRTYLPGDDGWAAAVRQAPGDLLSTEARQAWLQQAADASALQASGPFAGYHLPWAAGETMYLTQSVHHDKYDASLKAHYAFDFAKPGYPSGMFAVHAAKGGRVTRFVDRWPNGHYNSQNPNEANYLIIEDATTSPTTYQLYLHLAQGTIPAELKQVGAPVKPGQLIGVADDTGLSTGNHLHFHVHLNPNSYWDRAVDITFDEVAINGGRPRIDEDLGYCQDNQSYQDVCTATQDRYVSANQVSYADQTPPAGSIVVLSGPTNAAPVLTLQANVEDQESGLAGAQLRAYFAGEWRAVGSPFEDSPFTLEWDVCAAQAPVGPLSLALEAWDNAGNRTNGLLGLSHLVNNAVCPPAPPACTPTAGQVALFNAPGWQGACAVFAAGDFNDPAGFAALGADGAQSIQVGADVQATLYGSAAYTTRAETFWADDANLADNRIGAGTAAALKVRTRQAAPAPPSPTWPANGAQFPAGVSLIFAWENPLGGREFQVTLEHNGVTRSSGWLPETYWNAAGSLSPGQYRWQAAARSPAGQSAGGAWASFTVLPDETADQPAGEFPYSDDFETPPQAWSSDAHWQLSQELTDPLGGAHAWRLAVAGEQGYAAGQPFSANLTSPPIALPAGQPAYLRFWYWSDTEGPGRHHDQRWVQAAAPGESFANLFQLEDDAAQAWLLSPAIDLGAYAGRSIRLRFHFTSLDGLLDSAAGWAIGAVSVNLQAPAACPGDDPQASDPAAPAPIAYGAEISAVLCPGGERAYYTFSGQAGDQVGVRISSAEPVQALLLADDRRSVLAQGSAVLPGGPPLEFLSYRLPRSGTYTLKLKPAGSPGADSLAYHLSLASESDPPTGEFLSPIDGQGNAPTANALAIAAQDSGSGISHIQFFYHSPDWELGNWEPVSVDASPQDGWQAPIDLPLSAQQGSGFAWSALIFDLAGNLSAAAVWDQRSPPRLFLPVAVRSDE